MSLEEARRLKEMIAGRPQGASLAERRAGFEAMAARFGTVPDVTVTPFEAGGVGGLSFAPRDAVSDVHIVHYHGGAFTVGSPRSYREFCGRLAASCRANVHCPEYPLAPEHPFPEAHDATIASFRALRTRYGTGSFWVLAGDSAGGNLAVAACQALIAQGQRPPDALYLISPYLDLTHSGASIRERADRDVFVRPEGMAATALTYLAGASPEDDRASPLFGSVSGFPPTLIQVGADETLFSDADRLARRLTDQGSQVDFEEWEGMMHVFPFFGPVLEEARQATSRAAAFIDRIRTD
jgi:acetyl esterase/lipase